MTAVLRNNDLLSADGFCRIMKQTRAGAGFILFPVVGGEMKRQKIKPVNGLRVEIFRALCGKC
jgi:hypothetical protein